MLQSIREHEMKRQEMLLKQERIKKEAESKRRKLDPADKVEVVKQEINDDVNNNNPSADLKRMKQIEQDRARQEKEEKHRLFQLERERRRQERELEAKEKLRLATEMVKNEQLNKANEDDVDPDEVKKAVKKKLEDKRKKEERKRRNLKADLGIILSATPTPTPNDDHMIDDGDNAPPLPPPPQSDTMRTPTPPPPPPPPLSAIKMITPPPPPPPRRSLNVTEQTPKATNLPAPRVLRAPEIKMIRRREEERQISKQQPQPKNEFTAPKQVSEAANIVAVVKPPPEHDLEATAAVTEHVEAAEAVDEEQMMSRLREEEAREREKLRLIEVEKQDLGERLKRMEEDIKAKDEELKRKEMALKDDDVDKIEVDAVDHQDKVSAKRTKPKAAVQYEEIVAKRSSSSAGMEPTPTPPLPPPPNEHELKQEQQQQQLETVQEQQQQQQQQEEEIINQQQQQQQQQEQEILKQQQQQQLEKEKEQQEQELEKQQQQQHELERQKQQEEEQKRQRELKQQQQQQQQELERQKQQEEEEKRQRELEQQQQQQQQQEKEKLEAEKRRQRQKQLESLLALEEAKRKELEAIRREAELLSSEMNQGIADTAMAVTNIAGTLMESYPDRNDNLTNVVIEDEDEEAALCCPEQDFSVGLDMSVTVAGAESSGNVTPIPTSGELEEVIVEEDCNRKKLKPSLINSKREEASKTVHFVEE